jgi:hypothetical protein
MPEQESFADLRQKLDQLNRLEEDGAMTRRSGHSALDSEVLMESLRANIPLKVLHNMTACGREGGGASRR